MKLKRWLQAMLAIGTLLISAACVEAVGTCHSNALYCVDSEGYVHAQGMVTTGAITSTKPCNTGYRRLTPNFCQAEQLWVSIYTPNVGLASHFIDSNIPDGAYVWLRLHYLVLAGGATAFREMNTLFFSDSGAGTTMAEVHFGVYEHTAIIAGTELGHGEGHVILPVSNGGYIYAFDSMQRGNGNAFIDKIDFVGYFD